MCMVTLPPLNPRKRFIQTLCWLLTRLAKGNNSESTVNDSDSEEVEDTGKPTDGLVDDVQKKVETLPKEDS
nr:hypothetical protein [Tanacetum cinerariifolium]